jgi:hypothetical protein
MHTAPPCTIARLCFDLSFWPTVDLVIPLHGPSYIEVTHSHRFFHVQWLFSVHMRVTWTLPWSLRCTHIWWHVSLLSKQIAPTELKFLHNLSCSLLCITDHCGLSLAISAQRARWSPLCKSCTPHACALQIELIPEVTDVTSPSRNTISERF